MKRAHIVALIIAWELMYVATALVATNCFLAAAVNRSGDRGCVWAAFISLIMLVVVPLTVARAVRRFGALRTAAIFIVPLLVMLATVGRAKLERHRAEAAIERRSAAIDTADAGRDFPGRDS